MAFRQPKGWLLTASPRRNARQPFRRTPFPSGTFASPRRDAGAAMQRPAPAGAPGAPWWRAMLDAVAAAPRRMPAPPDPSDVDGQADQAGQNRRRAAQSTAANSLTVRDDWRPVTERLDRQREQLASMDEHLRQLVEIHSSRTDATAVYAPPA